MMRGRMVEAMRAVIREADRRAGVSARPAASHRAPRGDSMDSAVQPGVVSPLLLLRKYGQSPWLDYIRRTLITSGELQRLIDHDGLGGVTSNPAIFEKAITGSSDYTDLLEELQRHGDLDAMALYERLAIRDIQDAADVLWPMYDSSHRRDGYVSLEVSPFLAYET